MALFGTRRDAKFLASVNSEIINSIVDTEIEFFQMDIETSNSNIYGESESKSYLDSILLPCLITKNEKTANMDDYGHNYTREIQFAISRDMLEKADFYPEVGDIIFWDNEYYEIGNVDANQYFAGKNPDTWPNGDSHGYSVSVLCNAHITKLSTQQIKNIRNGGNNNSPAYRF
jgi:hypothetical protein